MEEVRLELRLPLNIDLPLPPLPPLPVEVEYTLFGLKDEKALEEDELLAFADRSDDKYEMKLDLIDWYTP